MKAIRVHAAADPRSCGWRRPVPDAGAGQVLLRVEAVGVNFVEVYHRTGLYPMPVPFTPGTEAAGRSRRWGRE